MASQGYSLTKVLFTAKSLKDHPSGLRKDEFPGTHRAGDNEGPHVTYAEGRLVGYKWYDRRSVEPLFWFGQGLGGYTTFEASIANKQEGPLTLTRETSAVPIKVQVKNTGKRSGKYVVQVYVRRAAGAQREEDEPNQKVSMVLLACLIFKKRTLTSNDHASSRLSRPYRSARVKRPWWISRSRRRT